MKDLREQLCRLGERLYKSGLTHGSTGNLSLRLPDGQIVITPTGSCLGNLDPSYLSILNAVGEHVDGPKPTKEVPLHSAFYESRGDRAGAIVHLHSCYSTALSLLPCKDETDWLPHLTPYSIMQLGQVRLLPYHLPGSTALGEAIKGLVGRHSAVMLANHGPVISAKDIDAAGYASEELEATAKLAFLTHALDTKNLTGEQIKTLVRKYHVEWN